MAEPGARTKLGRLPLNLRLPNAPPFFAGRGAALARLAEAIGRAPVSCVSGIGGLGKTALVCHVLRARFAERVPRAVMARLGRGALLDHVLLTVARALAEVHDVRGIDWTAIATDRDALIAAAIDLAEPEPASGATAHVVVLDDLHHAEPARVREVLGRLAQYARSSRWIAVSREDPGLEELMGQTVALDGMPQGELAELARAWGGALAGDAGVLRAAAGSPWRLKQLLAGRQPMHEPDGRSVLDGLPADAAELLRAMCVIEIPLPVPALARVAEVPGAEVLASLARRGLLERSPDGLRMPDLASALLAGELGEDELRARKGHAAAALAGAPGLRARHEALRLAVDAGDPARALALFDAHGEALLEAGFARALHRILAPAAIPELSSWRLRAAVETGDPLLLQDLSLPASPTPADRAHHSLALFHQGRYDEAAAEALAATRKAGAAGLARVAFQAGRTRARCFMDRGLFKQARQAFEALDAASPALAAQRDIDVAACAALMGQRALALGLVTGVEERLAALSGGSFALRFGIASALYALGAVRRAEAAAARLEVAPGAQAFLPARTLLLLGAIATDRGALADAAAVVDRLVPLAARSPINAMFARLLAARLRCLRGDLDGVDQELTALAEASLAGLRCSAEALRVRAAIELGAPPGAAEEPPAPASERTRWGDELALARVAQRSRWGLPFAWPELAEPDMPEVAVLATLARGTVALAAGDAGAARRAALDAAGCAAEQGYGTLEIAARALALEALWCSGAESAAAADEAAQLKETARTTGAMPCAIAAELLGELASPAGLSPARLAGFADLDRVAPAAARRARALLGDAASLDRIDRAVVEAARRRTGVAVERIGARDPGAEGRGIAFDVRSQRVWLPDRQVDLSERPLLFRILEVIAEHGGEADKETLVRLAWQEPSYHRLRHDARVHTAVRALRRLIEDDPASPRCIVTTPSGYAFGAGLPVRRIVPR
ncbi:winged helix-turn-helix domain-containing protein [Sorangium sp. So ce1504]|uniref:hypothetical protein n=1 Tax=Sorangium sp. So ce1504 TaxID=3133337 RepID=UPI003F603607